MLAQPLPPRVYSIADFILFATLLTSLLAAFISSHGTTFDSGLDGLGKVDSRLNNYNSESGSLATCVYYVLNATWHNFAVSLAIIFGQKFSRIKFSRKAKKTSKSSKIGALEIFRLYGILQPYMMHSLSVNASFSVMQRAGTKFNYLYIKATRNSVC